VNRLSQILGAAAVVAIAVVFILQFRPAAGQQVAASGPACAITVGGGCIETGHYWAAYRMMSGGLAPEAAKGYGLRKMAAEGLVDRYVLLQDAKRLGLSVSDADVTAEIVAGRARISVPVESLTRAESLGMLPRRLTTGFDFFRVVPFGRTGDKKFEAREAEKEIRRRTGLSHSDYREFVRQELLAARARDLVISRVHVGEAEAYEDFVAAKSTARLKVARFDKRFFAELVVDPSDANVEKWAESDKAEADKAWESDKARFAAGECRVARHILVKFPEQAIDDEKKKARKKIEKIIEKLDGASFADIARKYSQDPGSAVQGGSLGCVTKGQMVKPFEEALFGLAEGKRSDVVESNFGYHVILLEKIATKEAAEKVGKLEAWRRRYLAQETERLAAEGAKAVLAAVQGGKPIDEAVESYVKGLEAKKAPAAPKNDEKKGDAKKDDKAEPKKAGDAKNDEPKKAGDAKKEPAKGDDAKKDEPKKPEPPKADDVELEENPEPSFELHRSRPRVELTSPFTLSDAPMPDAGEGKDVAQLAFALAKAGDAVGEILPLRGSSGYAVAVLEEKKQATREDFTKERASYLSRLRIAKQQDALVAYIRNLRAKLATDVKVVAAIVEEPKDAKSGEAPADDLPLDLE
jgi:peptidyl-prolyl cis-trans isomerase D